MEFVRRFSVADVQTAKTEVVALSLESKLPEAFKLLVKENILSAPVVAKDREAVFVLDMLEICIFITNEFNNCVSDEEHLNAQRTLQQTTVEEILEKSERVTSWPVPETANLGDVLQALSTLKVHRVPVISNTGKLVSVVSQSAVVKLLWANMAEIGIGDKTLSELGFAKKDLYTIYERHPVKDAFALLSEKEVSAVAVVDAHGKIVGNISCRDLRSIGPNTTLSHRLDLSIVKFLELMQLEFQAPKQVVTATLSTKFKTVMDLLVMENLHRVWLVDEKSRPISVVSLRDVLMAINRL